MIEKPKECCKVGTYSCQVPMPLNGRLQSVDICIADIVAALNAANIMTVASCCGHGKGNAIISLDDGREIEIDMTEHEHIPYQEVKPDSWVKPKMQGYKVECCDCGLIHEVDFRVVKIMERHDNGESTFEPVEDENLEIELRARRLD